MAIKKNGRPTDYNEDYPRQARLLIEKSGFSITNMAKLFNVSRSTIYVWLDEHTRFMDNIRKGRKHFEGIKVHKALEKRAIGYRYTETVKELDPKTGTMRTVKKTSKQMAPDVSAIKHWQVNMDPDNWKDKKYVDGNLTIGQALADLEAEGRPTPGEPDE
jgi:hypothetical protein